MKKIILLFCVVLFVNASILKEVKNRYKDIDHFKLKNSMEVYLLSDNQAKNVSVTMKVKVGMDIENKENFGISHLTEHMIFRDQRVPKHDYLDYFKDIGAIYVNGFTKRYETDFVFDILKERSYDIVKKLPMMFFDKNITKNDLEVERSALQTEIGKSKWYYPIFWNITKFANAIFTKKPDVYKDDFKLSQIKKLPPFYIAQQNNLKFTLKDVLKHYDKYYYPANMRLIVVGNFDHDKMKNIIKKGFENIDKKGSATTKLPPRDAVLSGKPYKMVRLAPNDKNVGYVGYKYIEDSYKKFQIMSSYFDYLAMRLQQELRNKKGSVYGVNSDFFFKRGASIEVLVFDGLHNNFYKNKKFIENFLKKDIKNIDNKTIKESLREYIKNYLSIEHDSDSLYRLVGDMEYLKDEMKENKDPYTIFNSITYEEYKKTLADVGKDSNSYKFFYEDYYFFPYEAVVIRLVLLFAFFVAIIYYLKRKAKKSLSNINIVYNKRDIRVSRRLSNRLFFVIGIFFVIFFSSLATDWFTYFVSKYIFGDPNYIYTLDIPQVYIGILLGFIVNLIFFIFFYYKVFLSRYYARLDANENGIFLVGTKTIYIPKEHIKSLEATKWSFDKFTKTYGSFLRFWKDLLKIELKSGQTIYVRAKNAEHLEEDLKEILNIEPKS
ncbi:MAG: hypothetical protein GXO12_03260 [Epsilonproteobacteria bacterium]|nr:hypothetical protein [Campylobacterota bacterium]